jgi:hypothetical protein
MLFFTHAQAVVSRLVAPSSFRFPLARLRISSVYLIQSAAAMASDALHKSG